MFSFLDKGLSDIRGSTLFEGEPANLSHTPAKQTIVDVNQLNVGRLIKGMAPHMAIAVAVCINQNILKIPRRK